MALFDFYKKNNLRKLVLSYGEPFSSCVNEILKVVSSDNEFRNICHNLLYADENDLLNFLKIYKVDQDMAMKLATNTTWLNDANFNHFLDIYSNNKDLANIIFNNNGGCKYSYVELVDKYGIDLLNNVPNLSLLEKLDSYIPIIKGNLENGLRFIDFYSDSNHANVIKKCEEYLSRENMVSKIDNLESIYQVLLKIDHNYSSERGHGLKGEFTLKNFFVNNLSDDNINFFLHHLDNKDTGFWELFYNNRGSETFQDFVKFFISNNSNNNDNLKLLCFSMVGLDSWHLSYMDKLISEGLLDGSLEEIKNIYLKGKGNSNSSDKEVFMECFTKVFEENIMYDYDDFLKKVNMAYNKKLNDIVLDPTKIEQSQNVEIRYEKQFCQEDGKEHILKIIKLKEDPFISLTSSVVSKERGGALSDRHSEFTKELVEHPSYWSNIDKNNTEYKGTNFVSMSLNSDEKFKLFWSSGGGVVAGFSNISNNQIKRSYGCDVGTDMSEGKSVSASLDLLPIGDVLQRKDQSYGEHFNYLNPQGYNEFISDREGITPDYIMTTDRKNASGLPLTDDDVSRQWAAYYDIPIIEIDSRSYFNKYYLEFNSYYEKLKSSELVPTMEELVYLDCLKGKCEAFCEEPVMSYYELTMSLMNMSNREYSEENIRRLDEIIHRTFDSERSNQFIRVYTTMFSQFSSPKEEYEEELRRKKGIIDFKSKLDFYKEMFKKYNQPIQDELTVMLNDNNSNYDVVDNRIYK